MKLLSSGIGQAFRSPGRSATSATMRRTLRLMLSCIVLTSACAKATPVGSHRRTAGSGRCTRRVCTSTSSVPRQPACPSVQGSRQAASSRRHGAHTTPAAGQCHRSCHFSVTASQPRSRRRKVTPGHCQRGKPCNADQQEVLLLPQQLTKVHQVTPYCNKSNKRRVYRLPGKHRSPVMKIGCSMGKSPEKKVA